jgi:hypothetical protein
MTSSYFYSIHSHLNPVHNITSSFVKIHFNIILLLAEMPGVARVEISKPAIVGRLEVSPAIDSRPDRITPGLIG